MNQQILIVGFGDVGERVARLEVTAGHRVTALARRPDKTGAVGELGLAALAVDLDQADGLPPLEADRIYYFAPPPGTGQRDSRMTHFLAALGGGPKRLVYISTSGVYGDCQGRLVDEDAPLQPGNDRSRRRLDAERQLCDWAQTGGHELVILRVGGIYSANRLPVERLRRGMKILRLEEAPPSNRIHADDLAAICVAAMARGRSGEVYNVSDGHPSTMSDYFLQVAAALHLPPPQQISWQQAQAELSEAMLSYLREGKLLDNGKMLRELAVELRYPDLKTGLAACIDESVLL